MRLQRFFERRWYGKHAGVLYFLYPLMSLYQLISRSLKKNHTRHRVPIDIPVVIVGNILVGGTGKTPIIIALARLLQARGLNVGIVSRGYGRSEQAVTQHPVYLVNDQSTAAQSGDEPLEMFRALACPIVVASNRYSAVEALKQHSAVDVILSDDGLQHYKLDRHIEIAVFNQSHGVGNGHCLPVGPLREPVSRLKDVDFVLINQTKTEHESVDALKKFELFDFSIKAVRWVNVNTGESRGLNDVHGEKVCAMAGIGQPRKFFNLLKSLNLQSQCKQIQYLEKPDHAAYSDADFDSVQFDTFWMTAKDAVKCTGIAPDNSWYLMVEADLPPEFIDAFIGALNPYIKTH